MVFQENVIRDEQEPNNTLQNSSIKHLRVYSLQTEKNILTKVTYALGSLQRKERTKICEHRSNSITNGYEERIKQPTKRKKKC